MRERKRATEHRRPRVRLHRLRWADHTTTTPSGSGTAARGRERSTRTGDRVGCVAREQNHGVGGSTGARRTMSCVAPDRGKRGSDARRTPARPTTCPVRAFNGMGAHARSRLHRARSHTDQHQQPPRALPASTQCLLFDARRPWGSGVTGSGDTRALQGLAPAVWDPKHARDVRATLAAWLRDFIFKFNLLLQ
jgi:hypothetical protein